MPIPTLLPLNPASEYMLVLSPEEHVQERLNKVRRVLGEAINVVASTHKSPIVLARWHAWDMQETRFLHHLQVMSMEQYPFRVQLDGFYGVPSHSIQVEVTTRESILRLVSLIRLHKRLMQSEGHAPFFISEPQLVLTRGLTPGQYEKALQVLGNRRFAAGFVADGMLLLKKRAGSKGYQIVKRFAFEHLAVTATQTMLFA